MWRIEFTHEALKNLKRLPKRTRERIEIAIDKLHDGPYNRKDIDVKVLHARPEWRLRVGKWRVLFRVDNGRIIITVIAIDSRGDVYK
ncbi:MAG: type II toxin-antitoxin system RelE/ParE family toxin [Synergistaceae bacterium]|nr:type II toxin-antitoxin system RelE/ParE family toxin [Synergistaceae bacterium]